MYCFNLITIYCLTRTKVAKYAPFDLGLPCSGPRPPFSRGHPWFIAAPERHQGPFWHRPGAPLQWSASSLWSWPTLVHSFPRRTSGPLLASTWGSLAVVHEHLAPPPPTLLTPPPTHAPTVGESSVIWNILFIYLHFASRNEIIWLWNKNSMWFHGLVG